MLRLHPALAPIKAAVLPLQKKLSEKAALVYHMLMKRYPTFYDEAGSIGKRYRRMDEAGTPYCVTIDFDIGRPNGNGKERDSMEQVRMPIDRLYEYLDQKLEY